MTMLAHGVGTRADLPIPPWLAVVGAVLAVCVSFAALGLLWPRSRFTGALAGRPLPRSLAAIVDSRRLHAVLRAAVLALAVGVVAVAFAGPRDTASNLAPWGFYVLFWVGLVPISALFGPVWRRVNPVRTVHRVWCRVARLDPDVGVWSLPAVGYWPAAAALGIFAWCELVLPGSDDPLFVGSFLLGYGTLLLIGALLFGQRWIDRADGFEAYSTLVGRLSPLGRRADGQLVLRNPLNGLDAEPDAPTRLPVLVVLLGTTAFDGISGTQLWQGWTPSAGLLLGTAALVGTVAAVGGLFVAATRLSGRAGGRADPRTPALFAHSLVPIVVGYAVAHYFSLLVFDGQQVLRLLSDPLGQGADLFGTARRGVNYELVSARFLAITQVLAIVVGHVVAVVVAHDRAVRLFDRRGATLGQWPLLAVMVVFTVGGLGLLLGG